MPGASLRASIIFRYFPPSIQVFTRHFFFPCCDRLSIREDRYGVRRSNLLLQITSFGMEIMGSEKSSGERIRTLLVDDNPEFLKAAAGFLNAASGLEVVGTARSGEEALLRVDDLCPDLVLMDLAMPGMGGFEATCRLKKQKCSLRVVILTLHDTPEYRSRAYAEEADGFVPKTEFGAQLLPLVHDLFSKD